jgi:hypothetical protein
VQQVLLGKRPFRAAAGASAMGQKRAFPAAFSKVREIGVTRNRKLPTGPAKSVWGDRDMTDPRPVLLRIKNTLADEPDATALRDVRALLDDSGEAG